jgi:hypothetical protein
MEKTQVLEHGQIVLPEVIRLRIAVDTNISPVRNVHI